MKTIVGAIEITIPEVAGAMGQVDALVMCQSAAAQAKKYAQDAAQWLTGNGTPGNSLGAENQLYLDVSNGHVWKKGSTAWVKIAELTTDLTGLTALAQQGVDDAAAASAAIAALVIPVSGDEGTQVPTNDLTDAKYAPIAHASDTGNPHGVTKEQVGLENVTNDSQVKRSEMGVANGVATTGADGKVIPAQLPDVSSDGSDLYIQENYYSLGGF